MKKVRLLCIEHCTNKTTVKPFTCDFFHLWIMVLSS